MLKKFREYLLISKLERKILNQSFFWLISSLILVRLIPLKWFNSILGEFKKERNTELNTIEIEKVLQVQKNIRRLKRAVPWRVKCFEEAITAKKILEKNGIESTLYLGVDKNLSNKMIAHAWLKRGSYFIAGEKGAEKFKVVGFYS